MRDVTDLIRIAAAGGGFTVDAGNYSIAELVRIAAATIKSEARIHFANAGQIATTDLVRIAAAGPGCVTFDL